MNDQAPPPPDVPPGWYPDPDKDQTQRYWDGSEWTDQHAPLVVEQPPSGWLDENGKLTYKGNFALGLIVAGVGAVIAIVGVFLPLADTESSLHIAKNSLIQHWEGGVVIGLALIGFLAALRPSLRWITFLTGAALIGLAILAGTNLPIEYRNRFSEVVAGNASAGAGVWTVGVGGVVMAISAYFTDWQSLSGRGDGEGRETTRSEISSGQPEDQPASDADGAVAEAADDEEVPAERRGPTWREVITGRPEETEADADD